MPDSKDRNLEQLIRETLRARVDHVDARDRDHAAAPAPSRPRPRWHALAPLAAIATVLAVGGAFLLLTGRQNSQNSGTDRSTNAAASQGESPTPPNSSASDGQTLADCRLDDVTIRYVKRGGAGGTIVDAIEVRNDSDNLCRIQGFPQLTLILDEPPGAFHVPDAPNDGRPPSIELEPSESATAEVRTAAYDAGETPSPCSKGSAVVIALPHDTRTLKIPQVVSSCLRMTVYPFQSAK